MDTFLYDVFLSHSSKDTAVMSELAKRLRSDGLRVWLDGHESASQATEQGLEQSRTLVLAMSANAFASEWITLERGTALFRDPTNTQRRFVPLRLDDAPLKETLRQFAYVDWRQKSENEYARLLNVCRSLPEQELPSEESAKFKTRALPTDGKSIFGVAVTKEGHRAISGSSDGRVRLWDLQSGTCLKEISSSHLTATGVASSADGTKAVWVSGRDLCVWDLHGDTAYRLFRSEFQMIRKVAITSDGQLAVAGYQNGTLLVCNLVSGEISSIPEGHTGIVWGVCISSDGRLAVSGGSDNALCIWDLTVARSVNRMNGHRGTVMSVAMTEDGVLAVSGSNDNTARVWNLHTGQCRAILEGHTNGIQAVAVTPDGRLLVTGSQDKTIRVWDLGQGICRVVFANSGAVNAVAVTADGRCIISGADDGSILLYELPALYWSTSLAPNATRYTNAKVLLVGDSGVGKSGLAIRLTENRFEPTISTDGAWATQLKLPLNTDSDGIEREIWLWDFAGQSDYRLIHQLFMDETALAILVFNPQSDNPFEGLGQWDRDLQRAARRAFDKLLVAGRCDRGGVMVSRNSIERFRLERGFISFLETSAYTGFNCDALRQAIVQNIPWSSIPWTTSPRTFKLLKEEIVKLKDEGKVLLRMGELKQQLEMRLPEETFRPEHLQAVIGLLAGPGVVWQLEFGDFVLLQPERINAYAAAVIRRVRAHTDEIGVISEEDALTGKLDYQDMKRLPQSEEQIVLRAMHQTFVDHGLCLREPTDAGTLLVFPAYFRRERPELEGHPTVFVTYQFNGPLDDIYSTLVVRLHHTPAFDTHQLWRFAADFKTPAGKRVGIKMTKQQEGAAEIALYFEEGVPDDTKVTFIRYVHEHLKMKAQDVFRLRHYVCPHCNTAVENRRTALERLSAGLKDIVCVKCEKRIQLWDLIEQKFASDKFQERVRKLEEQVRISIDNESRELILVGHAFAIAGEAGQIFRPTPNSDWGIDGEIEFKNEKGEASGERVYLQLKSGDSYLHALDSGEEVFTIRKKRHAEYWTAQAYPVMLVIRNSDGQIRWMNVTEYLQKQDIGSNRVVFGGEPFTALNVARLRDKIFQQKTVTKT